VTKAQDPNRAEALGPRLDRVRSGDVELLVEREGEGHPIVLAHGLTATRRYVVHGSRLLQRSGLHAVSYDARGHGESSPAADRRAYEYSDLVTDLGNVMDALGVERVVLAGSSMGAATTLAFTLERPERVAALVQITPAHMGIPHTDPADLARWDELADAFEREGVDGFLRVYGDPPVDQRFKSLILKAIRQRLERHRYPHAVADAMRVVPRSVAFDGPEMLEHVEPPTLVVASLDELDPDHPYAVAQAYAERIPSAELVSEKPGSTPLAWRGGALSRTILDWLNRLGIEVSPPETEFRGVSPPETEFRG
jgi:pimeloyl-ACP methyl ester carboxylesterase